MGRKVTPAELRQIFRRGEAAQPTGALAPGFAQANLAIIPEDHADAFSGFLAANARACPLLSRGKPGDPTLPALGEDIDIRHDLPRYRVFRDGKAAEMPLDIAGLWQDDMTAFAVGCSLSFEEELTQRGVHLRSYGPGVTCSAFDTCIPNTSAGPFGGNLVVTMRAIRKDQVTLAIDITKHHPLAHGAPVHIGDPEAIGVDLDQPIDGIGLTDIREDETPVFWACGVTLERAIKSAALPLAITHAPGHMLITDRPVRKPESPNGNS